jgi:hypothetical protein
VGERIHRGGERGDLDGFEPLGNAEIKHFDRPRVRQHDVLRLQIAVHDPELVGAAERADHRHHSLDRKARRDLRAGLLALDHPLAQRAALEVLEHHVRGAAELIHLVDGHDVFMLAVGRGPRLGQKALDALTAGFAQELDRDQASELGVACQKDGPHATLAQGTDDLVVLEGGVDERRAAVEGRPEGDGLGRRWRGLRRERGEPACWLFRLRDDPIFGDGGASQREIKARTLRALSRGTAVLTVSHRASTCVIDRRPTAPAVRALLGRARFGRSGCLAHFALAALEIGASRSARARQRQDEDNRISVAERRRCVKTEMHERTRTQALDGAPFREARVHGLRAWEHQNEGNRRRWNGGAAHRTGLAAGY